MNTEYTCPFCGEGDFDAIGLKNHFEAGYCEVYESIETIREEWERKHQPTESPTGRESLR